MFPALLMRLADTCNPTQSFFGLPTWYKYLGGETDLVDPSKCVPVVHSFNDFLAIGLAFIDIMLYVAGFVAVIFVIYGGFLYLTSQGEPDRTSSAKNTLMNAVIGLVIVLIAITVVTFLGSQF